MTPDLARSRRLERFRVMDNAMIGAGGVTRPPLVFRSSYPKLGPCNAGCGAEILKRSPSQKCEKCRKS